MKLELILGFLADLIKRFIKPTPAFFKITQVISGIIFAIYGLPGVIETLCTDMKICIPLPDWWAGLYSQVTGVASIITILIAQLTATSESKEDLDIKG